MLIELSVPHRGEPTATVFANREDYIARCHAAYSGDGVVYDVATAGDIADRHGFRVGIGVSLADMRDAGGGWIIDLGFHHGWSTPLYRSDYLGQSAYSPDRIDEFDACAAWAAHDESGHTIVEAAEDCTAMLGWLEGPDAPCWGQCGPLAAAAALRKSARDIGWAV